MMFMHIAEAATAKVLGTSIECGVGIKTLTDLINFFTCTIVNSIVPLLFVLAIAGFVFGVIKFFLNPDNEEQKKNGKNFMMWGLIALFVIVSIWGIVGILSTTFFGSDAKVIPNLNVSNTSN